MGTRPNSYSQCRNHKTMWRVLQYTIIITTTIKPVCFNSHMRVYVHTIMLLCIITIRDNFPGQKDVCSTRWAHHREFSLLYAPIQDQPSNRNFSQRATSTKPNWYRVRVRIMLLYVLYVLLLLYSAISQREKNVNFNEDPHRNVLIKNIYNTTRTVLCGSVGSGVIVEPRVFSKDCYREADF